jgi:phage protein D
VAEIRSFGTRPVVTLDGTPLREELAAKVLEVVVDTRLHQPDMVQVTFVDPGHDLLRTLGVRIGSTCEIGSTRLGDGVQTCLVEAEITSLEADLGEDGSTAVLRGYDVSHRLGRGRRTATYNDVTDADLVRRVADRAGVPLGRVDDGGPTHDHVSQVNSTDWELLTGRARETGHELTVEDGRLQWRRPTGADEAPDPSAALDEHAAPLQLKVGTTLLSFRPRVTAGAQVDDVVVRGWDPRSKKAVVGRSRATTVAASVGISPSELSGAFGGAGHVSVTRPIADQGEADAVAGALAESLASVHAEAEGVAVGDPRLRAGVAISVGHAGWPFDGRYTLTSARHVHDSRGYRTYLGISGRHDRSLLRLTGGAPAQPQVPGVVPAVVTDVDDPDGAGRVKVTFPWLADDYESWWARLAQLGAGDRRGAVWLPEVGDEVLVAFEHGDTRRPYVVGGLYNGVDLPRLGDDLVDASTGAVRRRGFVSRLGHRLVFLDDDAKSGAALVSGDDSLRIALKQSDTTITISSSGAVSITGSSEVSVTSDGSITLDAGSTLTLKGGAGVSIDGGPQVEVSGGLITLN